MLPYIITILVVLFLIYFFYTPKTEVIGNWSHLFENMTQDPTKFYVMLKEILEEKEIPELVTGSKNIKQGGLLSYQRLYFVVSRGDFIFHICAAPWGKGFFFSWWARKRLSSFDSTISKIPFVGKSIVKARQSKSYYESDTDTMFRTSVQQAVLQAIDRITEANGIRGLSELERKPELKSVFK